MTAQVCHGATLACTFGVGPSTLTVTPQNRLTADGIPAATIMDHIPLVNVLPFPLCNSLANPAVIAATAAKLGVFTPAACLPATAQPWLPGAPTVLIAGQPALNQSSTLLCQWGGVISVTAAAQLTVTIP